VFPALVESSRGAIFGAGSSTGPSLSLRTSIRKPSLSVSGLQTRFKFGNSPQGFVSQCSSFTSDFDLSNALDVWHATVKRGDEFVQMTELARAIRLSTPLVTGHHPSF
jgi:hypothetical protein